MSEIGERNAMRLDVIAAKAKQLAHDERRGGLWPGQLAEGLREIEEQLRLVHEHDNGGGR